MIRFSSCAIIYASTSGRTRRVAVEISELISAQEVQLFDLRDGFGEELFDYDLIIMGSPTYGKGELHPQWLKHECSILNSKASFQAKTIAVFALGDKKHHNATFGFAISKLAGLARSLECRLVGRMPLQLDDLYSSGVCSQITNGEVLDGLLLDQVNERRRSTARIQTWLRQIARDLGANI